MGWLDKFKKKPGAGDVVHPGGGFESGAEAIREIILRHHEEGGDGWASIAIPGAMRADGKPLKLQVSGRVINLLTEDIDHHLATRLMLVSNDDGLYEAEGASAEALAGAIDTILREHFRVSGDYAVDARLDG
jgi:hypothetical protein